jgi:hypothetical protein
MRRLVAAVCQAMLVALSMSCASEEVESPLAIRSDPPPRTPARAEPSEREVVADTIDVAGVVATDLDARISGRTLVVLDARGVRQQAVTGDDGGFVFTDVVPPYDLTVAPSPYGAVTVLLGLRRRDPYVELFERDGPTTSPARQTIRVGVRAPACDAASCRVTAVTTSPSGFGSATASCQDGDPIVVLDVDHGWRGLSVRPDERIDVHLLVGDDERSSFAYARIAGVPAAPGDTLDVGVTDPAPVPVSEPVPIGVHGGAGALVDWRWTMSVSLDLSSETTGAERGFVFAMVPEASATVRLPLIPGARMRAGVEATHPRGEAEGGFFRSIEAWSGTRPLSVNPVSIDVVAGPDLVRPTVGGILSRRGLGFEWRSFGIAALSTLTVIDITRGGARFRVLTTGEEVSLARLAELGLPKLELGDHMLDLSTSPLVGIDDATSPDVDVRRRRHDSTRPGMTTRLRVPFQVTK